MSWIRDDAPSFAYITVDGDLILFEEVQSEVRDALQAQGIHVDPWPLRCTLQTIRVITETHDPKWPIPTVESLFLRISSGLRARRIVLGEPVIRAVVTEYMTQLRRHDIARIQYF